jgi:hypothetical protein
VQQVVMIVPVDSDVDEAEHVCEQDWKEWAQGGYVAAVGNVEFQHHDGEDDGEHSIAEGLKAGCRHRDASPRSAGWMITGIGTAQ